MLLNLILLVKLLKLQIIKLKYFYSLESMQ